MNYRSFKGEFVAFSDAEISLVFGKTALSILRTDVRAVKNREKNRCIQHGIFGALLGSVVGAAAGGFITSEVADSSEVGGGAGVGFLLGAGVGAVAGAALPSPVTVYQIREAKP